MRFESSLQYDPVTVTLHWLTAVVVGGLWIVGQTADYLPEDSLAQMIAWSSHVTFGFALAAILLVRLFWRATSGAALPPADSGALKVVAKATHYSLYGLLFITVGLGIANAFIRGYDLYHLVKLPQIGIKDWKKPVTHWHGFAANSVLILALIHAGAALLHHYVWRDNLLARMAWRGRS